jgi:hypothetical protein
LQAIALDGATPGDRRKNAFPVRIGVSCLSWIVWWIVVEVLKQHFYYRQLR